MSANTSLPSPTSTASTSPIPPPTPLTPNSAQHVSFATPPQQGEQKYAYDLLDNNTGIVPPPGAQGGAVRRKPSRRANTAERRATHNAVERQRRETLNGRFLDLAALLPNLASVRRPSKSAIVNSSIALIHTQRRARSTAARELRLLKLEADALRAEVNEWRERAGMGLAHIDEPIRSRDFEELVSGGLEEAEETLMEEERRALEIAKEGLRLEASGFNGDMMGGQGNFAYNMNGNGMFAGLGEDDEEDASSDGQSGRTRPGSQGSNGGALPHPVTVSRQNNAPMIFDPTAALLQAHPSQNVGIQSFTGFDLGAQQPLTINVNGLNKPVDRSGMWSSQMYNSIGQHSFGFPAQNFSPSSARGPIPAGFLGGYNLMRDEDALTSGDPSSIGPGSIPDLSQFSLQRPHQAVHQARTRSASSLNTIHSLGSAATPPASAPATTTTYAEANGAGDAFAAAYGPAFPIGRVQGGGNTFNAAMGLFM